MAPIRRAGTKYLAARLVDAKVWSEIVRRHENDSGTDCRADACVGQAGASPGPTSAIFMHSGKPKDHEVCAQRL